jgi:replicative DNA helicase
VIFSLEMTAEQISERMLSALGRVSMRSLRTGRLAEHEFPRLTATVGKLSTLPIHIEDEFCTDISAIVSRARQLHSKQPLSLIVVDYIQLVEAASVGKAANRETHVSEVARRLKLLTKELQVAVIAMSQLNDEGQLRESRAIGHHADLILCIDLASDSDHSRREIVIQKGRNIGFGQSFAVHFEGAHMTFTAPRTFQPRT